MQHSLFNKILLPLLIAYYLKTKAMKLLHYIMAPLCIMALGACTPKTGPEPQAPENPGYVSYHNDRYGFNFEYPANWLAQEEAPANDGIVLLSPDSSTRFVGCYTFRAITGENPTIDELFKHDLQAMDSIYSHELHDNYFLITQDIGHGQMRQNYVIYHYDTYCLLSFEHPSAQSEALAPIIQHMLESFYCGAANTADSAFLETVQQFLETCFYKENINQMARDGSSTLFDFVDPEMGLRYVTTPGTVPYLYAADTNYGFDEYTDFEFIPEPNFNGHFELLGMRYLGEITFGHTYPIYYQPQYTLPEVCTDPERLTFAAAPSAYPDAPCIAIYLPNGDDAVRGFYFIKTPGGWKLTLIHETLCAG